LFSLLQPFPAGTGLSAYLLPVTGIMVYYSPMGKLPAFILTLFALFLIAFGTWQLFMGNFEAAFSTFPFLLILFFFVKPLRR
jgi:hypothetical protein